MIGPGRLVRRAVAALILAATVGLPTISSAQDTIIYDGQHVGVDVDADGTIDKSLQEAMDAGDIGAGTPRRWVADCEAASGGVTDEVCYDTTVGAGQGLYLCKSGPCNGAGWERIDSTSGGGGGDEVLIKGTNVVQPLGIDFLEGVGITITPAAGPNPETATFAVGSNVVLDTEVPGGELGGTYAAPTVNATHSGTAHHTQAHALDGSDHTLAGATIGAVLRATGATTFAFGQLDLADPDAVTGLLPSARMVGAVVLDTESPGGELVGTYAGPITISSTHSGSTHFSPNPDPNVDHSNVAVTNAANTFTGTNQFEDSVTITDGAGDSPIVRFTGATIVPTFDFQAIDSDDDFRLITNTTSTENFELVNIGTGILEVFIETSNGVLTSLRDAGHLVTGTVPQGRVGDDHILQLPEIDAAIKTNDGSGANDRIAIYTQTLPGSNECVEITSLGAFVGTGGVCAAAGAGDVNDVGPGCATGACWTDGLVTVGAAMWNWEGTVNDTDDFFFTVPADPDFDVEWVLTQPTAVRVMTFPDAGGEFSLLGQTITPTEMDLTAAYPWTGLHSNTRQVVTELASSTFAVTSNQVDLTCAASQTINTITGGVDGMMLTLQFGDADCTIADDDDPTAADAINLDSLPSQAQLNFVAEIDDVLVLVYNGVHWTEATTTRLLSIYEDYIADVDKLGDAGGLVMLIGSDIQDSLYRTGTKCGYGPSDSNCSAWYEDAHYQGSTTGGPNESLSISSSDANPPAAITIPEGVTITFNSASPDTIVLTGRSWGGYLWNATNEGDLPLNDHQITISGATCANDTKTCTIDNFTTTPARDALTAEVTCSVALVQDTAVTDCALTETGTNHDQPHMWMRLIAGGSPIGLGPHGLRFGDVYDEGYASRFCITDDDADGLVIDLDCDNVADADEPIFGFSAGLVELKDGAGDSIDWKVDGINHGDRLNVAAIDASTTFAITGNDAAIQCTGAENINTITGGIEGGILRIWFQNATCTIIDDDSPAGDEINLEGTTQSYTAAAGDVLTLWYDGANWLEVSRGIAIIHDILSSAHDDTAPSAASDGSIIIGNVVNNWSELDYSVADEYLTLGAARPEWAGLTLSDADNQGTVTEVLHGNASGAVSFGSIVDTDLPSELAYEDEANVFASAGIQSFSDPIQLESGNDLFLEDLDGSNTIAFGTQPRTTNILLDWNVATITECDALGNTGKLTIDPSGHIICKADISGGSPTWDSIAAPVGSIDLISDAVTEIFTESYEANYTTEIMHLIRQQTGTPSGGTLLDVRAADADVTVARFGDGTNGITVSQSGILTSEGTGGIRLLDADDQIDLDVATIQNTLAIAQGGTNANTSADNQVFVSTGAGAGSYQALPASGAVAFNGTVFAQAGISDLAASTTASLLTVLSDEGTATTVLHGGAGTWSAIVAADLSGAFVDASGDFAAGVVDSAALASPQKTLNCDWAVEAPASGDDGDMQCHIPDAATLVRAYCSTDTGTQNINFYERTEAAPNTGTTGMLTSNLLCDTTGENTTSFADSAVAANANIALGLITGFTTGWVRVSLEYTVD